MLNLTFDVFQNFVDKFEIYVRFNETHFDIFWFACMFLFVLTKDLVVLALLSC